ncbi:uncharacterized protein LOC113501861 isoform X2 [Trichoplusia ni]|uniref:Uncharacterized protein LOC113501861 isoform X2 n=1 Tax=Trichoplusia ni TaxID=7111 RepID=A0A7E5WFN4_TRINI|nr:uncharacterized protein LOC113501861 isoform X2 [Trichoplusia ni]
MSEGDVSLIRDEDLLRRMWQQTEDFSRKKEIRAHMYRLREERLRNLYSPEPTRDGKGSEFSAAQGHVKSFADQSFQSMKSKEVRDAGSPPKEFTYRGQDLKALSNAGWNVESENKTTDDGHTHVKSVHANIEGRYDVDGGKGQFAAVDHHKEAITEYHDDNSSLKRNETSSNTAAREHVVRQTDDGTQISSTTSSSSATSKFQQMSSTRHETVPYLTNDDFDLRSYDTNRNEDSSSVTRRQTTKTNNDYEQSVRKNEYEQISKNTDYEQSVRNNEHIVTRSDYETGELVSRKVDYPDDNTRVVVETRCLPDGTRVTSTKREFRAPVQSTRSEQSYQTRENKSYSTSTQRRSDSRDSTKIIRNTADNRTNDIVDSQRNVDEFDFKRQIADYTTKDNEDYSDVQRYETKVNRKVIDHSKIDDDYKQTTRHLTKINKVVESTDNDDYVQTHRRSDQRRFDNADVRRETVEPRDERPFQQDDHQNIVQQTKDSEEKIHHVTRQKKIEEVVEKKTSTDQYQTTYQTDFAQKKISNDWSPSHQAWASTLRADTPTTTRPSTRASSPGSKTFKSSTVSLRSSVSPDKTYRKPNSRGVSPNKIDRFSPTRTVSDKYSSTHSTHSITEVKTNKFSSPEDRRPPSGRSPTRPGYSPERKPQDYRHRPSASPEKKPHESSHRPSVSPDRKRAQMESPTRKDSPTRPYDRRVSPTRPRSSPERKSDLDTSKSSPDGPANGYPRDSTKRPSQSPDRKPGYQKPTDNHPNINSEYPRNTSPSRPFQPKDTTKRPDTSPTRKPGYHPSSPSTDTSDKLPKESPPNRLSVSPDRTEDYNRPAPDSTPIESLGSPTKPSSKTPPKKQPSLSPERKPQGQSKTTTKIQEDHYKFIDEETKMYTRVDKVDKDVPKRLPSRQPDVKDKSPSPSRKSPSKDTPDYRETELPGKRSPSPKDRVKFIDHRDQVDKTLLTTDVTQQATTEYRNQYKEKGTATDTKTPREQSPSKYGTYDKKKPYDDKQITTKEAKENKTDDLSYRDKSPQKVPSQPASPTKKLPRGSISPTKSPTKVTKYKQTTDLLVSEKSTEETTRKTTKERPRQLVTPSSSPTRKPKPTDTEPSTGQSSPTTSVSGFVYFSSPRNERAPVTDLDDQEYYSETQVTTESTTNKRPESLDFKRSPSPSKIPCRSPTPEKRVSPSKDALPRKSSLKKPSSEITQAPPIEKPPSSFKVSPTEESKDFTEHKIVKKDRPEEPDSDVAIKPKPPLERRETYEDRCRKILGMMDDTTTTETITKQSTYLKEPETNLSSPSVSPCRSPAPKETPFEYPASQKPTDTKSEVIDFITHEQEHFSKITTRNRDAPVDKMPEVSRDTSPSKFKDDLKKRNSVDKTAKDSKNIKKTLLTKHPLSIDSPSNIPKDETEKPDESGSTPKNHQTIDSPRSSLSPERKPQFDTVEKRPKNKLHKESTSSHVTISSSENTTEDYEETISNKTTERKLSPTRKIPSDAPTKTGQSVKQTPLNKPEFKSSTTAKSVENNPKETSPVRPGYTNTTTSMITEYDSTTEDVDENITTETMENDYPSSTISTKPSTTKVTPAGDKPQDRKPNSLRQSPEKKISAKPKDSSPTRPGYKQTSGSVITKNDAVSTRDTQETIVSETTKTKFSSSRSPTRKTSKPADDSPSTTIGADQSPEHKPSNSREPLSPSPSKITLGKDTDNTSPPVKLPGYMKTTSAVSSKTEEVNIEEVSKITRSHQTPRLSESPTRQPPILANKPEPIFKAPATKSRDEPSEISPNEQPENKYPREESPSRRLPSAEKMPGYMKTTTSQVYKQDVSSKTEDISNIHISKIVDQKHSLPRPNEISPNKPLTPGDGSDSDFTRVSSPTKPSPSRQSVSPDRKPSPKPSESTKKPESEKPRKTTPNRQTTLDTPEYLRTVTTQHDIEVCDDRISSTKTVQSKYSSSRVSNSPSRDTQIDTPKKPHLDRSPNRTTKNVETSPRSSPDRQVLDRGTSPTRKISDHKINTSVSVNTSEDVQSTTTIKTIDKRQSISRQTDSSPTRNTPKPSNNFDSALGRPKTSPVTSQTDKNLTPKETSNRRSSSPEKQPNYMRPTASVTTKFDSATTTINKDTEVTNVEYRSPVSPSRPLTNEATKVKPGYPQEPEQRRKLRSPSPIKKTATKVTEISTDFLMSEREQEILDRVQKSLRKLSPERNERSPSRERSPAKTTTSLQDIDITTSVQNSESITEDFKEITETTKVDNSHIVKPKYEKPNDQKSPTKPPSRNVSPIKKPSGIATPTKADKSPDSPSKTRSISPKKIVSPTERPQSPQVTRPSGIKPKEQIPSHLTRKPTPATLNVTKLDRTVTDVKKNTTTSVTKQNSFTKSTTAKSTKTIPSPTGRQYEPETKRAPTPKGVRESSLPRKDADSRVTRTTSDITIKSKKSSPQRMKSKPEIQVSDMSSIKTTKISKSTLKEPHSKLPSKPKSATTLNTSTDEDDIIIDVQQSKSSRENSPDRICPTPVNIGEDIGTPRYPDEVSEPDDEFRRRTHLTIHETESLVDDIVEICEDDELFVRKTDVDIVTEDDESLLSVTDKVSRFTKGVDSVIKPKDTTSAFKDTERRVHSDFIDEKLKSDECLLSVSEKVNKFARGPSDMRDSKSPARRVVDEYDKNTVYQDDYTKLSVHDKAHLFVETAENVKAPKVKPTPQKVERPDLSNVDDSLKSDDCLLSVSDKVHKFVKTAEQFLTETQEVEEKEKKIKEQHEKIMRQIVDDDEEDVYETTKDDVLIKNRKTPERRDDKPVFTKETSSSLSKVKEYGTPYTKTTERTPSVKITTLRSSEAVKKAKALFENIATTQKTKETTHSKTTKLTDIGVIKKSPKTDSTTVLHPSVGECSPNITEVDSEVDAGHHTTKDRPHSGTLIRPQYSDEKPRSSPSRLAVQSPEVPRSKSPMRHSTETSTTTTRTVVSRQPATQRAESPRQRVDGDKADKVPGYLRPTKTSQNKEETKMVEETEVSSRRGSGKFGVELRRTSVERSTSSSERRRSVEHPCIEDIFDLDLLEQMLEKVVGYEQRRRIRAQIRIARKKLETDNMESNTYTRTTKQTVITQKYQSPERPQTSSPDRAVKQTTLHKASSPDRHAKTPQRSIPERISHRDNAQPVLNGHAKDSVKTVNDKRQRPHSPEKSASKPVHKNKSPVRQASPDKRTRTQSPSKTAVPKTKQNRFNEYASAYMKKVGLSEADKIKFAEARTKKAAEEKQRTIKQVEEHKIVEEYSTAKSYTERSTSKDVIDVVQTNGSNKRSPSPQKRLSPERKAKSPDRKAQSPERVYERTPSPAQKHPRHESTKKETIIKTVYDIEKKIPQKPAQEEKPSWITNRNLKKISSETRTFSSKKIEEKPKYRAPSPSKVITKPIDVITSSYGPGPLDADGKPLFGIRALRNGASNYQVKGTVIRSEYHSRNGGEPEGSVSVTAYSTEPEDLERLLQGQGEPPSRIHGLAAITTTKKFGGDTGTTLKEVHGREDRAAIDQFTHSDRRVSDAKVEEICETFDRREELVGETRRVDRREEAIGETRRIDSRREETLDSRDRRDGTERTMHRRVEKVEKKGDRTLERKERVERTDDKKTVRQSSVKSLTEKYIKSANESSKSERAAYPKAGLILRTATMKDSVSSDSSAHAGLARTDSEHSLASVEDTVVTTERVDGGVRTVTTTRSHHHTGGTHHQTRGEKSFLDSSTKVTGVQDILTRMKNADIVIQEGDTSEDTEARALLNKFLGATVLMAGMQGYVQEKPSGKLVVKQETVRTSSSSGGKVTSSQTRSIEEFDVDQCWDERLLRKLLDECNDYEQRRRLRARIRSLMAEQEACASAVTEALAAAGEADGAEGDAREEEEVTVTSSVRRNSSEKTVSSSTTTTKTSKVIESMTRPAPKPVSPFAKFRQLEKQNSTNSPKM